MPLPINIQFQIVIYAILAGLLTGIIFDLYKIIRGVKIPKIIIVIEDILFWGLTALIVFTFLLYTNYAFLGPYVYAFMLVTILIYLRFISNKIFKLEKNILRVCSKGVRIIFKNIIYPIKLMYSSISGKK